MKMARKGLGDAATNASLILRILEDDEISIDTAEDTAIDVEVGGLKSRSYVDIYSEARRYRAILGLRAGDRFVTLAKSNSIELPPVSSASSNALSQVNVDSPQSRAFEPQSPATRQEAPARFPLPPVMLDGTLHFDDPGEITAPAAPSRATMGDDQPPVRPPLVLEEALATSSYALGRAGGFEVNVELHVFGHAEPGHELRLLGRNIPTRPDGSFSIRRILPNDPVVIQALLNSGDGPADGGDN